jgi:hypothetical protein
MINNTMGNRGTTRNKPNKQDNWAGGDFKKEEEKRLKESNIEFITTNRGTSKIPVSKTKTAKKKPYKGKISGGRGTSSN